MKLRWYEYLAIVVVFLLIVYVVFAWNRETYEFEGLQGNWLKQISSPKRKEAKNGSKPERLCRLILESIYHVPFVNVRPYFLKNPKTGRNLELDCYNYDLKLAIEYNGEQHYKYTPGWHENYEAFEEQQKRDQYKKEMCQQHGITLIIVPCQYKKYEDIHQFLISQLRKRGRLPADY